VLRFTGRIGFRTAERYVISIESVPRAAIRYAVVLTVPYGFWQGDFGGALPGRWRSDASEL